MGDFANAVKDISAAFEQNSMESPSLLKQMKAIKEGERVYDELVQHGLIEPPSYRLSSINTLPLGVPSYSD